jgi:hypothetical protein
VFSGLSYGLIFVSSFALGQKWWLRGSVSAQLAETIILLLKDLASVSLNSPHA